MTDRPGDWPHTDPPRRCPECRTYGGLWIWHPRFLLWCCKICQHEEAPEATPDATRNG